MREAYSLVWSVLVLLFRSRVSLEAEILILHHQLNIQLASGEGLERRTDVTRNLSTRSSGFDTLPVKAQPASRKRALHGQRQRCS
jgi:hypothetical protein